MQLLIEQTKKAVEEAVKESLCEYKPITADGVTRLVKSQIKQFLNDSNISVDIDEIEFKYDEYREIIPANLYTALLMQGIFIHKRRIRPDGRYRTYGGTEYYLDKDKLCMEFDRPLKYIKVDVVLTKPIGDVNGSSTT
jgi:hypothetical protein